MSDKSKTVLPWILAAIAFLGQFGTIIWYISDIDHRIEVLEQDDRGIEKLQCDTDINWFILQSLHAGQNKIRQELNMTEAEWLMRLNTAKSATSECK